eukprot:Plantae.Rhodophyta-Rhodochaete_pulchella.ctg12152.p1 GENE.Plantae.Rhodophyta-Rhodochaete_pulchella.ctg12152~~Plantae.Rhodophyta-Rhodochaete_pulchella.ctg12152.p1  ORF type:complete len:526 (+),score=61.66 Plantae.Rhodophyta-Rhodochaete_pulchella.ctg12152:489-2066(+)
MSEVAELSQVPRNVNVGLLGHVDSGKTALARALSTSVSTAGLDKHPQSRERGITLDLGFTSLELPSQPTADGRPTDTEIVQCTLVDCPGHASLIRTVMGGAQIIDAMILVVDATRGIQKQTVECLVIGVLATRRAVVALNKIDLLEATGRKLSQVRARLEKALLKTELAGCPVVPISASPRDGAPPTGVDELKHILAGIVGVPERFSGPFLLAADHCFNIKGRGPVVTGTILVGTVRVGDSVEVPIKREQARVKGIQSFKRTVHAASAGDRVGLNLSNMDVERFERGFLCAPGTVSVSSRIVARVQRVRLFRGEVRSKSRFHLNIGHDTVMASATFFNASEEESKPFLEAAYEVDDSLPLHDEQSSTRPQEYFALLEADGPVCVPAKSLVVGARLDLDAESQACRLAFTGSVIVPSLQPSDLKLFRWKDRQGTLERIVNPNAAIVRGLFSKDYPIQRAIGLRATIYHPDTQDCISCAIASPFGQSGKVRVEITPSEDNVLSAEWVRAKVTVRFKRLQGEGREVLH